MSEKMCIKAAECTTEQKDYSALWNKLMLVNLSFYNYCFSGLDTTIFYLSQSGIFVLQHPSCMLLLSEKL